MHIYCYVQEICHRVVQVGRLNFLSQSMPLIMLTDHSVRAGSIPTVQSSANEAAHSDELDEAEKIPFVK